MLRINPLSFVDKQAKPMTAATKITGTVFSLDLPVVKTCLVDLVRIDPIELVGGFLDLLVSETCLVDLVLDIFDVSPNVVVLIIEIVIVFNLASYILVFVDIIVEFVALIFCYLMSIVRGINSLICIFPIMKVCCLLIGMDLPSSHHYIAKIATASMTPEK